MIKKFLTGIFICAILAALLISPEPKDTPLPPHSITVHSGDTLWKIACRYYNQEDPRDVIAEIEQMNEISADRLYPGQVILLPHGTSGTVARK